MALESATPLSCTAPPIPSSGSPSARLAPPRAACGRPAAVAPPPRTFPLSVRDSARPPRDFPRRPARGSPSGSFSAGLGSVGGVGVARRSRLPWAMRDSAVRAAVGWSSRSGVRGSLCAGPDSRSGRGRRSGSWPGSPGARRRTGRSGTSSQSAGHCPARGSPGVYASSSHPSSRPRRAPRRTGTGFSGSTTRSLYRGGSPRYRTGGSCSPAMKTHPANAFGMVACSGRMTPQPREAAKAAAW